MGKSVRLEVRVWYDEESRQIKLAGEGLTASTVSNDPDSKRYHPNLYRKLAQVLRNAGVPVPVMETDDAKRPQGKVVRASKINPEHTAEIPN